MISCSRCNSSGHIVAVHRETRCIYGFLCTCDIPRVRKLGAAIPVWNDRQHSNVFEVDFAKSSVILNKTSESNPTNNQPIKPPQAPTKEPQKDYKILAADPHAYDESDDDLPF